MRRFIYFGFAVTLFHASAAFAFDLKSLQKEMDSALQQLEQGGGLKLPNQSGSGLPSVGGMPSIGGATAAGTSCSGVGKKKLECICRDDEIDGSKVNKAKVLKSLPSPNTRLLEGDFSGDISSLNVMLDKSLDESTAGRDVLSLDWYKNAFESPEFAVVFSHFLTTKEKADLISQIKQVADKKAGFNASAKAFKRDAQQAYGVILLYYSGIGANKSAGMRYIKAAAKSNPTESFIATYQMGHRAYKGIDQKIDLSAAANWMLKSFTAVQERQNETDLATNVLTLHPAFVSLVEAEFISLVSEPNYKRRKMYAQLIQQSDQMRQEFDQAVKDAKGQSPGIAAAERAYLIRMGEIHGMLVRSTGNAQRATSLEERTLKFKQDREWSDQKSKDLRISIPGTDEMINEVVGGMGAMSEKQDQEFRKGMRELAILVTDLFKIRGDLIYKAGRGEFSPFQLAAAKPLLASVSDSCSMLNRLNNELVKKGKPLVVVSDIGEDSDTIELEIPPM